MRAHVTWSGGGVSEARRNLIDLDHVDHRRYIGPSARRRLIALEWFFLLIGLLAVDCYVWINTSTVLYQAYEDWAFDQTMRGLKASIPGFVTEEIDGLFNRGKAASGDQDASGKFTPVPRTAAPLADMVIGRLQIPRLGISAMVREGASEGTLSRAVGHIPGTALPGRNGNVALAGHRDTFFRALRNIRKHDAIEVETSQGTFRYIVESTKIVGPRDVEVLNASGGQTLTLVTCYPFYYIGSAPKRFIVRATEVSASPQLPLQRGS
jgi:sortase A